MNLPTYIPDPLAQDDRPTRGQADRYDLKRWRVRVEIETREGTTGNWCYDVFAPDDIVAAESATEYALGDGARHVTDTTCEQVDG